MYQVIYVDGQKRKCGFLKFTQGATRLHWPQILFTFSSLLFSCTNHSDVSLLLGQLQRSLKIVKTILSPPWLDASLSSSVAGLNFNGDQVDALIERGDSTLILTETIVLKHQP